MNIETQPQEEAQNTEKAFSKESAPAPHMVYAIMKPASESNIHAGIRNIVAIYNQEEDALAQIKREQLQTPVQEDMYNPGERSPEELIKPLFVYEGFDELPEEIKREMRPTKGVSISSEGDENTVYALLKNSDMTEGRGSNFVWLLTKSLSLATVMGQGNGISGSNCEIIPLELNKPLESDHKRSINLDARV